MNLVQFPFERVIQINTIILSTGKGMKGTADLGKLQGALSRIDTAIHYQGLDDVFEIAAKYASSIATAHALSDANKRTGLAVALEYLSLNDFELKLDEELLADAMRDLVIGEISESDFADILYSFYVSDDH